MFENIYSACKLAKKAYDEAISELDGADKQSYEDTTFIVDILRDNLSVWTGGSNIEITEFFYGLVG